MDLSELRSRLGPYYSDAERPSIDPELMRMLVALASVRERRPCDQVHVNLAHRWFCRLRLDDHVPEHSTFSKNRYGRFRKSDLFRKLFETVVARCMKEGIVGGEAFAVETSMIVAPLRSSARRRQGGGSRSDVQHGGRKLFIVPIVSPRSASVRVIVSAIYSGPYVSADVSVRLLF